MSYLDLPRIHFSGGFFTDPSTVNNSGNNYDPANALNPMWNAIGLNTFRLQSCKVRSAVLDPSGAVKTAPADDPIIGATVEIDSGLPASPKLVDLDPEWQSSSQIFALQLAVAFGSETWVGTMQPAALRDLWMAREPAGDAMRKASGTFQSLMTTVSFAPFGPSASTVFNAWKKAGSVAIRFVCYNYDTVSHVGKIVGTLGPGNAAEPREILKNARRLESNNVTATRGPRIYLNTIFGPAPFVLDEARKRVVIDLGNALPEVSPGGPRVDLGVLKGRVTPTGGPAEDLGVIDYTQTRYETTAGVEELTVTSAQIATLKNRPLELWATKPSVRAVLSERPRGSNLEIADASVRMNPGDTKTVDVFATRFGAPEANLVVNARLTLGGLRSATGLAFTVVGGRTDAGGKVQIRFTASDPGKARLGGKLDGQIYFVELDWGKAAPGTADDWRNRIIVKIYDTFPAVATPIWTDVRDIFTQYARLYPAMKAMLDLSVHATVKANKDRIKTTMSLPDTDPRFMPVSRDMSRDKTAVVLRWLSAGAPP